MWCLYLGEPSSGVLEAKLWAPYLLEIVVIALLEIELRGPNRSICTHATVGPLVIEVMMAQRALVLWGTQ